jgi:glycine cleavage system H protein
VELPENLKYTSSHEWIADNGDGTVTIGITVVESTKAASDVYAPVSGEVVARNDELGTHPEKVNESPYGAGWLYKLKLSDPKELGELLGREAYAKSAGV